MTSISLTRRKALSLIGTGSAALALHGCAGARLAAAPPPADAAALFQTMAPEFAAGFLGRMRAEAAAAVISGMTPESAYSISVLIAGRNALVPKN